MKTTLLLLGLVIACGPGGRHGGPGGNGGDGAPQTCPRCSSDNSAVVDCDGNATACPPDQLCSAGMCMNGCQAAEDNHASIGCDYYAVDMDAAEGPPQDACYTVFVANTSRGPVHINAEWNGTTIDLAQFAKLPQGQGQSLTFGSYDPVAGLAPGQVAILFLAYAPGANPLSPNVACPVPAAIGTDAQISGDGFGHAFHITTDLPVVAYQMLPFGGGKAAATGASLLLPTSAWGTNYVGITAYDTLDGSAPPIQIAQGPSMNIVAKEDGTTITMRPMSAVAGGNGIPAAAMGADMTMTLNKGQYAQITQSGRLTGSPISADKPVGVFGGHQIMSIDRCCGDHGEQMIAPVRALGYEYVAAPHGDRKPVSEERIYRIIGAVNNTHLTYDPPNVGPATVNLGQILEIRTATPFTVRSDGDTQPFLMFTYMSGAGEQGEGGWGDADFVRLVPPQQYMTHYVFFADPT
ncbi:MAG TPA: IgGFc-binding protein, partial [Kofleriaceae bacterium]|nr:IgGFc-binding protein [Kofleriaceae bacterium]